MTRARAIIKSKWPPARRRPTNEKEERRHWRPCRWGFVNELALMRPGRRPSTRALAPPGGAQRQPDCEPATCWLGGRAATCSAATKPRMQTRVHWLDDQLKRELRASSRAQKRHRCGARSTMIMDAALFLIGSALLGHFALGRARNRATQRALADRARLLESRQRNNDTGTARNGNPRSAAGIRKRRAAKAAAAS